MKFDQTKDWKANLYKNMYKYREQLGLGATSGVLWGLFLRRPAVGIVAFSAILASWWIWQKKQAHIRADIAMFYVIAIKPIVDNDIVPIMKKDLLPKYVYLRDQAIRFRDMLKSNKIQNTLPVLNIKVPKFKKPIIQTRKANFA